MGMAGGGMAAGDSGSSTYHSTHTAALCKKGSPSSSGGMGDGAVAGCGALPVRSRLAEEPLMSMGFKSSYSIESGGWLGEKLGEKEGEVPGNISDVRYG